jgi:hypothetical protein
MFDNEIDWVKAHLERTLAEAIAVRRPRGVCARFQMCFEYKAEHKQLDRELVRSNPRLSQRSWQVFK